MLDTYSMAKQLSGRYKEVFEWVDIYSTPLKISEDVKDERIMELYDLLVEAEHNGKPVEKVVGKDLETFCKNFFEEDSNKFQVKELLYSLFKCSLMFFAFSAIDLFWAENTTDLLPFLVGIMAGFILDIIAKYFLQPLALKKRVKPIVYYLSLLGIFLCIVVLVGVVCWNMHYEIVIGTWILLIITGSYAVVYLVVNGILKYRDHGNLFNKKREEKKAIQEFNREIGNANLISPSVKGMAAQFKRIRKRKQRRGIDYTFAEYAVKVRKAKEMNKWVDIGVTIFVALLVLAPSIDIMLEETFWDGLFFMAIMAVVEFFICRFFLRSGHNLTDLQIQIIEECETRGIDILQYQEELQKTIDE